MSLPTPGPVPGSQRLDLLDALRGFALAGVLLANLDAFSLYFFLPREAALALPTAAIDRWLDAANGMLVSGKFITLFSIMFGIGFALQMQRMGEGGRWRRRNRRSRRRWRRSPATIRRRCCAATPGSRTGGHSRTGAWRWRFQDAC
jgi:uncharacterized protein